jgi:phosphate starvation-inducible PhoH-like protein
MELLDASLGELKQDKKRTRKTKKQTEKELYNEFCLEEKEKEKHSAAHGKRRIYENLQYLSQNEKNIFESKFTTPINQNQKNYVNTLKNKSKKIIVVAGPAGTGKTLFATEFGVRYFLTGVYDKLIFTRPSVSVDEDLGFLPGSLDEKMAPWIRPIYDILYNFMTAKEVQAMMEEKMIEIAPLGYMRGRTFKNSWIVADEMQNSTISQMKMLLTRLGENSRLIITGDLEQYDRAHETNGLEDFMNKFRGRRSSSITSFEFEQSDIQREEVVKEILDIYSSADIPTIYVEDKTVSNSENSSEISKEDESSNIGG